MGTVTRFENMVWEMRLGISTRGIVDVDKPDACHYATVDYRLIHAVLHRLALAPRDVLIDIGCGKGRVLCCAARMKVRQIVGVEYDSVLAEQARTNVARLRGRKSAVAVIHISAEDFDYHDATAIFMFNPFGPQTLDIVLSKIERDTANALRLAFINPSSEQSRLFERHGWSTVSRLSMGGHEMLIGGLPVRGERTSPPFAA